jgi:hypothetical protein
VTDRQQKAVSMTTQQVVHCIDEEAGIKSGNPRRVRVRI